jgi:cell division protein ZapA
MAQVDIEVNGRTYQVGCEDGQEAHLKDLAAIIDKQVRQVGEDVGQLGETRLMLMSALLMADELSEVRRRLALSQADLTRLQGEHTRVEQKAVQLLEAAAAKIETMAG